MIKDPTLLSNSELFQEYNFTPANEFKKRAWLRAEIDRRFVDNETKLEILSIMPHRDSRRTELEKASLMIAGQLSELDPELLWRLELTVSGKLTYMTVGEACQVYKNNTKWGLV
jgi:hypothetical protein